MARANYCHSISVAEYITNAPHGKRSGGKGIGNGSGIR